MADADNGFPQVLIVGPDEGKRVTAQDSTVTVKLTPAETGGALCITHLTVPGNFVEAAPPPHYQTREEEIFYILKGTITFEVRGQPHRASAGSLVKVPRNLVHKFSNPDPEPAELLILGSPAGIADFMVELYEVLQQPGPPDIPKVIGIFAEYGLRVVPPGVTEPV